MTLTSQNIFDLNYQALTDLMVEWGEPVFRTDQVWHGLYKNLHTCPDHISNLPKQLRQRLTEKFGIQRDEETTFSHLSVQEIQVSHDHSTRKTLFSLPDGRLIEAVLMRYDRRNTLCISTQSGCAMGCVFCATGRMGFGRHLTRGEIVEQVMFYTRLLAEEKEPVTNVVLMGMGEPFHNYDETLAAIEILNDKTGLAMGARRFTVSTVGLIPMINRFAAENRQVNLAVSLHAVDDDLRSSMLPVNKRYPVDDLLDACTDYVKKTGRRITFEWALIENVNDTHDQAKKLAAKLSRFKFGKSYLCHVNAIPLNPIQAYAGKATSHSRASQFQAELEKHGIPCTIRLRRGIDIQAGCGQLAGKNV